MNSISLQLMMKISYYARLLLRCRREKKRIIIWSIMSICITVAVCIHSSSSLNNFSTLFFMEAPWKHYKWDFWLNVTAAAKCCCIIFCIIHEWEVIIQQRCCEVIWDYELAELSQFTTLFFYKMYKMHEMENLCCNDDCGKIHQFYFLICIILQPHT